MSHKRYQDNLTLCVMSVAFLLTVTGCAPVRKPIASPSWITPQHFAPTAHEHTAFDVTMRREMVELRETLDRQYRCCGENEDCRENLRAIGTRVWDKALAVYELTHTNVPVADKIESLKSLHESTEAINVCVRPSAK
jgi:hypothetical protein